MAIITADRNDNYDAGDYIFHEWILKGRMDSGVFMSIVKALRVLAMSVSRTHK